jgi:hypothetical protein
MVHMRPIRNICVLIAASASAVAFGGVAHADVPTTIATPDGGVVTPDGWLTDFTQVHVGSDSGVPQWLRQDRPDGSVSFVHAAAGRCLDLADPDDGGSPVVIRDCSAASASQGWERRGMALVDRDTGECATVAPRIVDGKSDRVLVAADCVLGDPQQAFLVLG